MKEQQMNMIKMKWPRIANVKVSPWFTLIIGYIIGYVLYPTLRLWTCDCKALVHQCNQLTGALTLSKWITIEEGRLKLSFTQEEFIEEYLNPSPYHLANPWRLGTPRYLSNEYTVRKKLLVGVITTERFLQTRARAVYETWGQDVEKIIFFVGSDCSVSRSSVDLPIVKLPGILDDVYPPQKKMFAMLKYMQEHYIDDFQWFMRADDDVYVRGQRLEEELSRMDPNERVYLGRAGSGKRKDLQRLQLLSHEHYCMGGPGVVLSNAALKALAPHLDYCLSAVEFFNQEASKPWYNEDVELGRCISRTLDVQCSSSTQAQMFFIQDYNQDALKPSTFWYSPMFRDLLTVHPIKEPENLRSLHHFYRVVEFRNEQEKLQRLQGDIKTLCKGFNQTLQSPWQTLEVCEVQFCSKNGATLKQTPSTPLTPKLSLPHLANPRNRYELMPWIHFNATLQEGFSDIMPQHELYDGLHSEVTHLLSLLEAHIKQNMRESQELRPVEVLDGYSRFSPELGQEFILDIKFAEVDNFNEMVQKRVRLIRPLGQELLLIEESPNFNATVNVIVPVAKPDRNFEEFMSAYEIASLQHDANTRLVLAVFGGKDNLHHVQSITDNYTTKYASSRIAILAGKQDKFSVASALNLGMSVITGKELVFLGDVNTRIQPGFFNVCRQNTILGERVYFPVAFATSEEGPELMKLRGRWASYSFQLACLYKADFILLGGATEANLFQRAIEKQLEVMQAPEPRLLVVPSEETCNSFSEPEKKAICLQVRTFSTVDQVQAASYLYDFTRLKHSSLNSEHLEPP